jgi:Tfp pilus assembly protein PilO
MTITKKINLSIITFAILVILLVVFIIFPLFREIKDNSRELISQKESLATLEEKIGNLEKFKILYKELEQILEKIDNLFINSEVPVEFISFLETTAENCQQKIEISPTSAKKSEKELWSSLTFQIASTGSFPNFLKFLEKLETSPYLIEIKNINISKSGEGGDVKAIFSVKVFAK